MSQLQGLRRFGTWACAALVISCAGLAFAAAAPAKDPPMPAGAKITVAQAKDAALKAVPGKVTEVKVERKGGKNVYAVEIMTESKVEKDVFVDIVTGKVISTE